MLTTQPSEVSVLPSLSPIPSFSYLSYPVDYPSIYPADRRAFRELKTKNTLKA